MGYAVSTTNLPARGLSYLQTLLFRTGSIPSMELLQATGEVLFFPPDGALLHCQLCHFTPWQWCPALSPTLFLPQMSSPRSLCSSSFVTSKVSLDREATWITCRAQKRGDTDPNILMAGKHSRDQLKEKRAKGCF